MYQFNLCVFQKKLSCVSLSIYQYMLACTSSEMQYTVYDVIYRDIQSHTCTGIYQYMPRQDIEKCHMTSYDVI